eukprot:6643797-Karenia_brevis.AAC.1
MVYYNRRQRYASNPTQRCILIHQQPTDPFIHPRNPTTERKGKGKSQSNDVRKLELAESEL